MHAANYRWHLQVAEFFIYLCKSNSIGHYCPSLSKDFYMRPDAEDKYLYKMDIKSVTETN